MSMFAFGHPSKIIRSVFREVGTFQPQVRRPYQTHINEAHVNHIAAVTNGCTTINSGALASISSQILKPQTQFESFVNIAGGFNNTRFRFMIEILVSETNMARVRKVLLGYTDKPGALISGTQALDPSMVLYVNNILTVRDTIHNGRWISQVTENDQLLSGIWDASNYNNQREHVLRPEDVVRGMGAQSMVNQFAQSDQVIDFGSTFANGIMRSNRQNTLPSAYLSNVLNAGINAARQAEDNFGMAQMDAVAAGASSLLLEKTAHEDPVLQQFQRLGNYFQAQGCISIGELAVEFPDLDSKTQVFFRKASSYSPMVNAADSQVWTSFTTETVIATQLAHAIPSVMFDTLIARAHFVMTNMTENGQLMVTPVNQAALQTAIDNIDVVQAFNKMAYRLTTEVHPGISEGGQMPYHIEIICDPYGDIQQKININNIEVPYISPCFCDAAMTSLVTTNSMALPTMSADFNNLLNNIQLMVTDKTSAAGTQTFTGTSRLW